MTMFKYILVLMMVVASVNVFAQREYSTKSKKAIKHFEEALRYYSAKRNSEALDLLQKAVKADDGFVEAYAVSGDCYTDLGDLDKAIINYQKVVDLAPDFMATSYKQLADVQFKTGDYRAAIGIDGDYSRLDQISTRYYNRLAYCVRHKDARDRKRSGSR